MSEPHQPEDEIEASRAPLLDHLVELRQRLVRSLIAVKIEIDVHTSQCWLTCIANAVRIHVQPLEPSRDVRWNHRSKVDRGCSCRNRYGLEFF